MKLEELSWQYKMSHKHDGVVSASLMSLQLQLKSLLQEAGGDGALAFLDKLCMLNPSEQKIALALFSRIIERIATGDNRLLSSEDAALKNFEEDLFNDIVNAMDQAERAPVRAALSGQVARRLEVLDGGRAPAAQNKLREPTPIDFNKARKSRKLRSNSCLN